MRPTRRKTPSPWPLRYHPMSISRRPGNTLESCKLDDHHTLWPRVALDASGHRALDDVATVMSCEVRRDCCYVVTEVSEVIDSQIEHEIGVFGAVSSERSCCSRFFAKSVIPLWYRARTWRRS